MVTAVIRIKHAAGVYSSPVPVRRYSASSVIVDKMECTVPFRSDFIMTALHFSFREKNSLML